MNPMQLASIAIPVRLAMKSLRERCPTLANLALPFGCLTAIMLMAAAPPALSQQNCPVTEVNVGGESVVALYGKWDANNQFVALQAEDFTKNRGNRRICPFPINITPCKPACTRNMGTTQICIC